MLNKNKTKNKLNPYRVEKLCISKPSKTSKINLAKKRQNPPDRVYSGSIRNSKKNRNPPRTHTLTLNRAPQLVRVCWSPCSRGPFLQCRATALAYWLRPWQWTWIFLLLCVSARTHTNTLTSRSKRRLGCCLFYWAASRRFSSASLLSTNLDVTFFFARALPSPFLLHSASPLRWSSLHHQHQGKSFGVVRVRGEGGGGSGDKRGERVWLQLKR